MIKSIIRKEEYRAIYRFLDRVSPLPHDCGGLCNAVCCGTKDDRQWDEKMGIYLLPGEDKIHDKKDDWLSWSEESTEDYEFPPSWKGKVFFVKCKDAPRCPREKRPIQCRTFPLSPHFLDEGHLTLIWSSDKLPYTCPLIEEGYKLEYDFVKATYTVWKHLTRDPLILDLIETASLERERDNARIKLVYDPLRPDLNEYIKEKH
ncbi:MAG: hypothetical protein K5668_01785 [Lachnospiraceae bacterium]|nr:hypothetical protein [Lachnospiraceae bacterium]